LAQSKAQALGKKGRAASAAKKRREDPNAERRGAAKNVATKVREAQDKTGGSMYQHQEVYMVVHNGKEVAFYKPANIKQAYRDAEELVNRFGGEAHVKKVMREGDVVNINRGGITEESQDDRNARIIAGEIEDAMSLGNEKVAQEKIKRLTQLGYYFDKQGRLQRMGMYEEQDACYRKVKSRYKVWPSAYASGALVQCRKKGAANWGNKSKK
jgi:hypothetical protein